MNEINPVQWNTIDYYKVRNEKCPECRQIGEKRIRTIGNNQYLYYYHKNKKTLKTCYLGKVEK